MNINSTKTHKANIFRGAYLSCSYTNFLKPSNEAIEFFSSKLCSPYFICILYVIVFLSASIITLPLVSSFLNSAISVTSYAPGLIAKIVSSFKN